MRTSVLILSVAVLTSLVMMTSAKEEKTSSGVMSWLKSSEKGVMINRAVAYAKGLYNSWRTGRGARNIFSGGGGDDEYDDLLMLLLGLAALALPLILGGLLLAAIIPFIGTTLNPINNFGNLGTAGLTGLTGNIPTITANTINPGGRRRRDVSRPWFGKQQKDLVVYAPKLSGMVLADNYLPVTCMLSK